jgi:hypothetical protein
MDCTSFVVLSQFVKMFNFQCFKSFKHFRTSHLNDLFEVYKYK